MTPAWPRHTAVGTFRLKQRPYNLPSCPIPSLQVFLPAEHDTWMLLAIDLQALARQATRSPHARLRALQVGGC